MTIVHLGRDRATGERRRVESWARLLAACGAEVNRLALMVDFRLHAPSPTDFLHAVQGRVVPETMAWSTNYATAELGKAKPDMILCVTTRAYDPAFEAIAPVVIDYVDSLAGSYGQRAPLAGLGPKGAAYLVLSRLHRRVETSAGGGLLRRVAAGFTDARALGAEWVPIVAWDFREVQPYTADHDFVFVGNLGYLPNIEALQFLGAAWPEFRQRRPETTLIVAGRQPAPAVMALAARHSWTVLPDFHDIFDVLGRGSVALAPVQHLSGISTKVLDSAAMGVPQVVTPEALSGVAPGFPAVVAEGGSQFAQAALNLLRDVPRRTVLGRLGRKEMQRLYSVEAWQPWVTELVRSAGTR